jgi:pseudouridine synthase
MYDVIRRDTGRDLSHLRYVGRLDRDSEGLLLLTNDGTLIHALTHPRYHVKKVYLVQTLNELAPDSIRAMVEDGVESEGDTLRAGSVKRVDLNEPGDRRPWYEFELYEGKKRQIRRMVTVSGGRVNRLVRVRFACVKLDELAPGALRPLTEREVAGLRAVGYKVR